MKDEIATETTGLISAESATKNSYPLRVPVIDASKPQLLTCMELLCWQEKRNTCVLFISIEIIMHSMSDLLQFEP